MGSATVIIKINGIEVMCGDWNIEDIVEYDKAKTIYNDTGDELFIPAKAIEEKIPGDESEYCTKYTFDNVEVYVEFI